MEMGMIQIMWKEIGIGFLVLYVLRSMLDIYMIKKYEKIERSYGMVDLNILKSQAKRHLKLCDFFSVGPWNKKIYAIYNGLCWLMSSISLLENNEADFLTYLNMIKKEQEFEIKAFALSLYYRSKKDINQGQYYYNLYLASKHTDKDIAVIMDCIWNGKEKTKVFFESVEKFKNPALKIIFKKNCVL